MLKASINIEKYPSLPKGPCYSYQQALIFQLSNSKQNKNKENSTPHLPFSSPNQAHTKEISEISKFEDNKSGVNKSMLN